MTGAVALFLALLAFPARGEPPVRLGVQDPLSAPTLDSGSPFTVAALVENRGTEVRGRLQVLARDMTRGGMRALAEAPVILPPASRTRHEVLAFAVPTDTYEVALRSEAGELARVRVGPGAFHSYGGYSGSRPIVLLSPGATDFAYLRGYFAQGGIYNALVRADPRAAPGTWLGWSSAAAVVVHDLSRLALGRAEQQALVDYAAAGGTLLLVSSLDPAEYLGTPLEGAAPFRPTGTRAFQGRTFLAGEVVRGKVLVDWEGQPVMVGGPYGHGQVAQVLAPATDPGTLGGQSSWRVWVKAVNELLRSDGGALDLGDLAIRAPEMKPMPFAALGWAVALYLLVVGPVNYMVLRRLDRTPLLFLTVPLAAALFSGASLAFQFHHRGAAPVLLESGRIGGFEARQPAVQEGVATLIASYRGSGPLRFAPAVYFGSERSRYYYSHGYRPQSDMFPQGPPLETLPDGSHRFDPRLSSWSVSRMGYLRPLAGEARVVGALRLPGGRAEGTLDNRLGLDLEGCRLVAADWWSEPFDLPRGRHPIRVRREVPGQRPYPEALVSVLPEDPTRADREVLLRSFGSYGGKRPLVVGWVLGDPGTVAHEGETPRRRSAVLVVLPLEEAP